MTGAKRQVLDQNIDPRFFSLHNIGSCCWGCARQDGCPMEIVGRKCTRDHTTCPECTWWRDQICPLFVINKKLLKM